MTLLDRLYTSRFYAPLNEEQRAAASANQPLIVVSAGAGTGKTQTLVARYLRLLLERVDQAASDYAAGDQGADAGSRSRAARQPGDRAGTAARAPFDHLLAITYTNAAADEMRERIEDALRELGLVSLARQMNGAWISTFHGFCVRVLKRHAFTAGVDPYFTVLDDDEHTRLRRQSFDAAVAAYFRDHRADLLRLLDYYSQGQLRRASFRLADETAKRGLDLARLQPEDFASDDQLRGCPDATATRDLISFTAAWQDQYAALKQGLGTYDYDDLLLKCRAVLREEAVREQYRAQFTEVMLDEAQDSNDLQLSLLEDVARRRFIVGDFKQSIYRFQGANVGVFNRLVDRAGNPADPTSCALTLARNYRSRGEILDYVNRLFSASALMGEKLEALEVGTAQQRAPAAADYPLPVRACAVDPRQGLDPEAKLDSRGLDRRAARQEAEWIAQQFSALLDLPSPAGAGEPAAATDGSGPDVGRDAPGAPLPGEASPAGAPTRYQPGDLVVLVAKRRFGQAIVEALAARGKTARIIGEDDFLEQPIICDARALLAALRNPGDDQAFLQLLLSSLGRVSDQGLYELACAVTATATITAEGKTLVPSLWDAAAAAALSVPADAENLRQTLAMLRDAAGRLGATPLSEVITRAFAQRCADDYYRATSTQGVQDLADLRHLCRIADSVQEDGGSLIDLIAYLDDKEELGAQIPAPLVTADAADVVRIMTVHAAKGLQFPVVAVACAQDMRDPVTSAEQVFVCPEAQSPEAGESEAGERVASWRLGLKYKPVGSKDSLYTPAAQAAVEEDREAEAFEKIRQLYVACTRAEQILLLSYRADAEKGNSGALVRALQELPAEEEER